MDVYAPIPGLNTLPLEVSAAVLHAMTSESEVPTLTQCVPL